MRGKSHGRTLASFGGIIRIRFKGSPASYRTLSHCGSPAVCLFPRIGLAQAKSTTSKKCGHPLWTVTNLRIQLDPVLKGSEKPQVVRRLLASCRLYVGVENGHPLPILLFPHRSGIVGTGHILAVVSAFDLHFVRTDNYIFFI